MISPRFTIFGAGLGMMIYAFRFMRANPAGSDVQFSFLIIYIAMGIVIGGMIGAIIGMIWAMIREWRSKE